MGASRPSPTPALKRTLVRPGAPRPDPVDGAFVATRLTTLVHELSNLLDGSMRIVALAKRSVDASQHPDTRTDNLCPEQLSRQLDTVRAAMVQMADLVRSSAIGLSEGGSAGMRTMSFGSTASVAEAVGHAVDVMMPLADECRVQVDVHVASELSGIPAGPIYPVVVNGVKNAIESIQRVGETFVGGCVIVRAWLQPASGTRSAEIVIDISDDGQGVRARARRKGEDDGQDMFSLGFSTKPGGSGIGLALSKDVISQLGGSITLRPKAKDPHSGRCGAVLTISYPMPNWGQRAVG